MLLDKLIRTKSLEPETFLTQVDARENREDIVKYLKSEFAMVSKYTPVPFNKWQMSSLLGHQRPYTSMNPAEKRAFWEIVAKIHLCFKRALLAGGVQAAIIADAPKATPIIYDGQARHVALCALYRELIDPAYQVPNLDDYIVFLKIRGIGNPFTKANEEVYS